VVVCLYVCGMSGMYVCVMWWGSIYVVCGMCDVCVYMYVMCVYVCEVCVCLCVCDL
jgi:hypothetical protein